MKLREWITTSSEKNRALKKDQDLKRPHSICILCLCFFARTGGRDEACLREQRPRLLLLQTI